MNDDVINIVKILNFPVENNQTEEIDVNLQLDINKNSYRISDNINSDIKTIDNLITKRKLCHNKSYSCNELFVLDKNGEKYTFCDCSFWCNERNFTTYIDFAFSGIISGNHIKNMKNKSFDKIGLKINYKKPLKFELKINGINVEFNPICNAIDITLIGNNTFAEYEKILWRLSEFMFLKYEDMFFYDTFCLYSKEQAYKYKSFIRSNDKELRKNSLKTIIKSAGNFCEKQNDEIEKNFNNFVSFREKSGIIFDVFRTTVYSNSFREDYPLRLSQVMEGLANYLEIADTLNRRDTFNSAIQLSLYCNDFIKEQLPLSSDIQEFAKALTEHRNKFSHVKSKGNYLKGDNNEKYAEILYTTIRVLIMKYLKDKI